jgi:hypothetical protein
MTGLGIGVLIARGSASELAAAGFVGSIGAGLLLAWGLGLVARIPGLRWWPLVGGLAFVGLAVVIGALGVGPQLMRIATDWWPAAVIALGGYLLWTVRVELLTRPAAATPGLSADDAARAIREEAARRVAERSEPRPLGVAGPGEDAPPPLSRDGPPTGGPPSQ